MSEHPESPSRLKWTLVICGALFLASAIAQSRVHFFQQGEIISVASRNHKLTLKQRDPAKRGVIVSRDGKVLAEDDEGFEFSLDLTKVPQSPGFFTALSAASGIPASEFLDLASRGAKRAYWNVPMTPVQAARIREVMTAWSADGVSVAASGRRSYPMAEAAAGIVGVFRREVGPDKTVHDLSTGLEKKQAGKLEGRDGVTVGMADRNGEFLPMRIASVEQVRRDGSRIELTIDSELQLVATQAIREAVESNDATRGSAVVIDPSNGDILAMANWPSFNPNLHQRPLGPATTTSDFNMNTMGAYEPGSTFKILTMAKAIDEGLISESTSIYCKGTHAYNDKWRISCDMHNGTRAHGQVDTEAAIAKSCNVSAAMWALQIGYPDFVKFIEDLGVLKVQDIGLPNERPGLFNYGEYAKPLQLMNVGFGQALNTTPLGLCSAYSMLGNGGVRMKPRLIKSIDGRETAISEAGRIVSAETATRVLHLMESVIEKDMGTGSRLRIPGFRLAGKTGTAQKIGSPDEAGGHVSNFVGYVPAEKPRVVILVMVDAPKRGRIYGSTVAGPVFHELAKASIRRLGIAPSGPVEAAPIVP